MSMTISGLGSGFDVSGWVSSLVAIKQSNTVAPLQSKLSTLQTQNNTLTGLKGKYSNLQNAIQTFTKTLYNSSNDMWTNTSISSSDSDCVSATSSGNVTATNVDVVVKNIATSTVAKSVQSLGSGESVLNTEFTKLANGQAKTGTFSMFVDNKRYQIEIEEGETLKQVIDKINAAGMSESQPEQILFASLDEETGKLSINAGDKKLVLGSSGDTSNIVSALKLYDEDGSGFKSAYAISKVNTSIAMASAESGLGAIDFPDESQPGIIKINGEEFTIDKNTTLDNLISKINGNSDTHVKASYDSLTNKFVLTATETGASNIALEETNTNLLNVLGLTTGSGENEKLAEGSQELGKNAHVVINGNEIVSNSNVITGASSGISNLSITIKKATPTDESGNPTSVTLGVEPDYTKVKEALKTFVDAYNDVVTTTKTQLGTDGNMAHDSSLQSILNTIRGVTTTSSDNEGTYSVLSQIGITSSSTDPTKLTIDDAKLDEVLKNDFDSVKLLLSDGYLEEGDTGLFDKLAKNLDNILDTERGFFTTRTQSIDSQIKLMNTRIDRANTQLSKYESRITEQFNRMDSIMSQLSSQLSTFQAYIG